MIAPSRPDPMLSALGDLNLKPTDTFKITASNGVLKVHKYNPGGAVMSVTIRAKGSFQQVTHYDPSQVTAAERRKIEADMYKSGLSQATIADLLGVSQATVSLDLAKVKKVKK